MLVYYTDSYIRNYYTIISNIIVNYKEQALIIGIKSSY